MDRFRLLRKNREKRYRKIKEFLGIAEPRRDERIHPAITQAGVDMRDPQRDLMRLMRIEYRELTGKQAYWRWTADELREQIELAKSA